MDLNKTLENISNAFKQDLPTVKAMYEKKLSDIKNAGYDMTEEAMIQMTIQRVMTDIQVKQIDKTEDFEVLIVGTDGRVANFAEMSRNKIKKEIDEMKKAGKSEDEIKAKNMMNEKGEYLYPQTDMYRKGQVIPANDFSISLIGITKTSKGFIPTTIISKSPDVLDLVGKQQLYNVKAQRGKKSDDKNLFLYVKDSSAFTSKNELKWADYVKACSYLYSSKKVSYDKLLELSDNIPSDNNNRIVLIDNVDVISVRTDIGQRKSTVAVIQVPDVMQNIAHPRFGEIGSINVWIPKELNFNIYQYQKVSVVGMVSPPDKERGMATINAIAIWCDEKFYKKELPKLPLPRESHTSEKQSELKW